MKKGEDSSFGYSIGFEIRIRKLLKRINDLIKEMVRTPFKGTGKPEPLRHALGGYWSRRINDEHRLVYKVEGDAVLIAQARYHY